MPKTYNFKAKKDSRKMLLDFIKSNLLPIKPASQIRVLCLPGPEALEIIEIYDELGIPRKNISCVERDIDSYQKILDLKTGCEVFNTDIKIMFKKLSRHAFDIVSLDLMGHIKTFYGSLFDIVKNGYLSDNAIVFTNFSGTRESDDEFYKYFSIKNELINLESEEAADVRKNSINYAIYCALTTIKNAPYQNLFRSYIKQACNQRLNSIEEGIPFQSRNGEFKIPPFFNNFDEVFFLDSQFLEYLLHQLDFNQLRNPKVKKLVSLFFKSIQYRSGAYYSTRSQSFKYFSGATPMYGDMFFLKRAESLPANFISENAPDFDSFLSNYIKDSIGFLTDFAAVATNVPICAYSSIDRTLLNKTKTARAV
jgi:hypothetical protein